MEIKIKLEDEEDSQELTNGKLFILLFGRSTTWYLARFLIRLCYYHYSAEQSSLLVVACWHWGVMKPIIMSWGNPDKMNLHSYLFARMYPQTDRQEKEQGRRRANNDKHSFLSISLKRSSVCICLSQAKKYLIKNPQPPTIHKGPRVDRSAEYYDYTGWRGVKREKVPIPRSSFSIIHKRAHTQDEKC